MATASAPNITFSSHIPHTSPPAPIKGFKKVFSHRRRSSDATSEDSAFPRKSVDSLNLSSTSLHSPRTSPSRDDEARSSFSGVHKLIPGHSKRQRQRVREAEMKAMEDEPIERGRAAENTTVPPPSVLAKINNRSVSSLLTDGSENDTPPPLVSRNSHTGYFTTSSPLIKSKTVDDGDARSASNTSLSATTSIEAFPVILEPKQSDRHDHGSVSPKSPDLKFRSTPLLQSPTFGPKSDTLHADHQAERRGSISKLRGKSPARKIREVFSRSARSPQGSPEKESPNPFSVSETGLQSRVSLAERRLADNQEKSPPPPLSNQTTIPQSAVASSQPPLSLQTTDLAAPKTPPSGRLTTPLTTVTPPTPTDVFREGITASPKVNDDLDHEGSGSEKAAVISGNTLGHRRVRSGSSSTHQKSKLSTSMTAPLTPTIEESNRTPSEKVGGGGRNFTASSGFFSSWVSAAQTAASSITNLTGQNRSRAGTSNSEPTKTKSGEADEDREVEVLDGELAKKQLAVETLGSGNLDFSQLGIDTSADDKNGSLNKPSLSGLTKKSDLQRDEAQAKVEDLLAKRAVSAAYGEPGDSTPVAELSDPVANFKHSQPAEVSATGTLTPPNGSIYDGETQPVKRSGSVRSRLGKRRSRGSSVATGQSTVSTTIGSSATALANPTIGTRPTGFTSAPKQRNRGFHQQFRSVPEDDNLIEDYSCALQKEILLAGRIYISEGHICFSSNILGWVTTLIISFEEIVSIERENTAMIIPNAIAIQTLHARHTFRSLLSREATFDLMIGIWKHNHPASFLKSVNGKQLVAEQARHEAETALGTKTPGQDQESEGSSDEGTDSDEDDHDEDSNHSAAGSTASIAGSEFLDNKSVVTRQPSGTNTSQPPSNGVAPAAAAPAAGDSTATATVGTGAPGAVADFPGPATHGPTDCTDSATHYDKIIKDEVIAAPLGKIYSLLYGPQSGVFVRKYLVDECKCLDLVLEDDKKGLTSDGKSRQYSYIKPLGGAIGPKQTKCITTENLDFFDLEKSVSVTCTTQTPDVPSGNAFATKTRYCLSWAPGNATRFQMNCTIEWSAKSWLKGPIEKGANDGQQQYGDGLIKALKAALGRSRGGTIEKKGSKSKKKRKGEKRSKSEQKEETVQRNRNWGLFEPLRPSLEPVVDIIKPLVSMEIAVGILFVMVVILWFGSSRSNMRQLGTSASPHDRIERFAAYEQLWQREESDLWDWLEDRAGVHRVVLGGATTPRPSKNEASKKQQKSLRDKSMAARLQAEKWNRKEMQEAVRVTRERLDEMQRILDEKPV